MPVSVGQHLPAVCGHLVCALQAAAALFPACGGDTTVEEEAGQHSSMTPELVGQQSPATGGQRELARQEEEELGCVTSATFVVVALPSGMVGLVEVDDGGLPGQQSSHTPSLLGQQSPA